VTINTDDPAMTDLDLGTEYRMVAMAHGLDRGQVERLALDGIASTWLDPFDQAALTRSFETELASLHDG
jgi:adenosine deaminase